MKRVKSRAALLVCAAAMAGFAGSASARPLHKSTHALHASTRPHDVRSPDGQPYPMVTVEEAVTRRGKSRGKRRLAGVKARTRVHNTFGGHASAFGDYSSNSLVSEARKYLGTNPTGRSRLWCGAFLDMVLKRTGHRGGGNLALAYAHYGTRVSGPRVGAIAVIGRRGGGHVGVVSGIDPNGNPIIISGNHNHTTAEAVYPAGRIRAYVIPSNG